MQALGFIKVNSGDVRLGKLERELCALECGFLSLTVVNKGEEASLLGVETQGFVLLPSLLGQRFPVTAPAILGLSGSIWPLVACYQDGL